MIKQQCDKLRAIFLFSIIIFLFHLTYSEDLTDAVARGTFTKSENISSIDFPNSFSVVWQTCKEKKYISKLGM